jgi:hypothetical protein
MSAQSAQRKKKSGRAKDATDTERLLKAIREHGSIIGGAEAAGWGRRTVYEHIAADLEFAGAVKDVFDASTDRLEERLYERAMERSDTAAIFLLKARRPEIYRELPRGEALEELRKEERRKVEAEVQREIASMPAPVREHFDRWLAEQQPVKELTA